MSFILDALKKSDRKRQVEPAPNLDAVHEVAPPKRTTRRPLVTGLVLLVVLLNAGFLFWFAGRGPEQTAEIRFGAQRRTAPAAVIPPEERSIAAEKTEKSVKSPLPKIAESQTKTSSTGQRSTTAFNSAEGSRGLIYAIDELPGAIRGSLPELHMSLHAYSKEDAAASLVRINNLIMREGTLLAEKFLLEEITADGAVFSYQGYRFVLPRKPI